MDDKGTGDYIDSIWRERYKKWKYELHYYCKTCESLDTILNHNEKVLPIPAFCKPHRPSPSTRIRPSRCSTRFTNPTDMVFIANPESSLMDVGISIRPQFVGKGGVRLVSVIREFLTDDNLGVDSPPLQLLLRPSLLLQCRNSFTPIWYFNSNPETQNFGILDLPNRRDEKGGTLQEDNFLKLGEPAATGEGQQKWVARNGSNKFVDDPQRRHVEIPDAAIIPLQNLLQLFKPI
ncbi:hypothetical protein C1H46_013068 [Malus baccata]|uniref:Uncharacterized protein n=1 Tax=Malus baccata TaxID=106549 RepID=A0A540MR97_MALBA|nr:hypothetical protein C1H46_013068 [Malus baccata]